MVTEIKPIWDELYSGKINVRREVLEIICIDIGPLGVRTLKPGIPSLHLFHCARSGDQAAYDLLYEIGADLDFDRPKLPGGRDANAARDFAVDYVSTILLSEYPELCRGANNATVEGTSAVDMIRKTIEDTGLGCIDYRKRAEEAPIPRSMERAIRRFQENPKNRELFWPDIDKA